MKQMPTLPQTVFLLQCISEKNNASEKQHTAVIRRLKCLMQTKGWLQKSLIFQLSSTELPKLDFAS